MAGRGRQKNGGDGDRGSADLTERVTLLEARLTELEDALDPEHLSDTSARYPHAPPTTMHDLEDFVVAFVMQTMERSLDSAERWCAQWYRHPEAVTRLRLVYETYRVAQAGSAHEFVRWLTGVFEPQLAALLDPRGPFARCSPHRHERHDGLRVERNPTAEQDWGPRESRLFTP